MENSPKKVEILKSMSLANTKSGTITISHIEKPYGKKSKPVVSIGISLKGDNENPDWKAHIPYENIQEVLEGLNQAYSKYGQ